MSPQARLQAGLLTLALAGGLAPFVLFGLLGLLLFPVGLGLAGAGLWVLQAEEPEAGGAGEGARGWAGALIPWAGLGLVALSAWQGGSFAFSLAMYRAHPAAAAGGGAWLAGGLTALAGASLLSAGLRRAPDLAPGLPGGWFTVAAAVFPLAALLFRLLSAALPFRA